MRRLLIFVIVLYIVWRLLGIVGRRLRGEDARERVARRSARGSGPDGTSNEVRRLVACARCGTLVPEDRAVRGPGGELFCKRSCLEPVASGTESRNDAGKLPPPTQQT